MSTKTQRAASYDWQAVRRRRTSPRFRAAYAERRLELEVAAMIHRLRKKRGISQEQLAHWMGTKQSAIARLEGGGENITLSRLQRIASVLGAQVKIQLEQQAR